MFNTHSLSFRETLNTPSTFYSVYTFLGYSINIGSIKTFLVQVVLRTTPPTLPSHDMNCQTQKNTKDILNTIVQDAWVGQGQKRGFITPVVYFGLKQIRKTNEENKNVTLQEMRLGYNVVTGFAIVLSPPHALDCHITLQALAAVCTLPPGP